MGDVTLVKSKIADRTMPRKRTGEVEGKAAIEEENKLRKGCADFEAIFTFYMFKTMRQTIPQSGFLKQSPGKDTYTMMLDQKVAEELANKGGGSGLQQILFEQLSNRR
jgi:peptidoglycan hydrolase FlgJ